MEIPQKINNIMQRILESEEKWKALYMASWGCVFHWLEPEFKNTVDWEKQFRIGLPASRKGYKEYTPAKLCEILKSKDNEFTLGYLQTLFSLFEELIDELHPLVSDGRKISAYNFIEMERFLLGQEQDKFNIGVDTQDLKELKLAKKTRNCFIHNNSKIDEPWIKAYKNARGENLSIKIGDELSNYVYVPQVEDWYELIIKIINKIKETIIAYEYL